MNIYWQ